ncbi:hypothetical protein LCGC14_0843320 [marine sediment metagenome]|uniref:Uncharacterized protein n=1 Tax=marine sediment metagenome TaxID=412755 RepID=A0A0F9PCG7_9ZZZZ
MQSIDNMDNAEVVALVVVKLAQVYMRMTDLLVRVTGVRDSINLTQKACQRHEELASARQSVWEAHCASLDALKTLPGWEDWMLDGPNERVYSIKEASKV